MVQRPEAFGWVLPTDSLAFMNVTVDELAVPNWYDYLGPGLSDVIKCIFQMVDRPGGRCNGNGTLVSGDWFLDLLFRKFPKLSRRLGSGPRQQRGRQRSED